VFTLILALIMLVLLFVGLFFGMRLVEWMIRENKRQQQFAEWYNRVMAYGTEEEKQTAALRKIEMQQRGQSGLLAWLFFFR
jgi:hypothetical protein